MVSIEPSSWKGPKRRESESYVDYCERRIKENEATKAYLKGFFFWRSAKLENIMRDNIPIGIHKVVLQGTYRRPKK